MLRLILFLAAVVAFAIGFSWLADRPGDIVIDWEGYRIETNVFHATMVLAATIAAVLALWSLMRHIWESPASVGRFFQRRRQTRGLDALSSGMIAISAGDREQAMRYAIQARKSLPNEPLTHLLRAQAAQLTGDKATSRRIYEAMLSAPDTEQLGLRGLYLEAMREDEQEAALQFAQRAVKLNPKIEWSVTSLFDLQSKRGDWQGALDTLAIAKRHAIIEKPSADRRRAVLLTAQAQAAEHSDQDAALSLALEAHGLAPDLIPASAIAARLLASRANTPRAAKVIQKTWKTSPHPDLAVAYAYARLGDSPRDRLERVVKLAAINPHSIESPIALATSAIEAKDFAMARHALEPLLDGRLTQRVCTLMAQIESKEHGNTGRVREWLARAVNAPRDPAWTADGIVTEEWAPISPATGALDAFQWRVPVEIAENASDAILANKLEELVALGAPNDLPAPQKATQLDDDDTVDVSPPVRDAKPAQYEDTRPNETDGSSAQTRHDAGPKTSKIKPREDAVEDATPVATVTQSAAAVSLSESDNDADTKINVTPDGPSQKAQAKPSTPSHAKSARPRPSSQSQAESPKPQAGSRSSKRKRRKKANKAESQIFVSPRAPDDPGTEASVDTEDGRRTSNPYRRRSPS